MKEEGEKKIFLYNSYTDDLITSKNQNYKIKSDYKWIHNNIFYRMCSQILYFLAYIISFFYCRFWLHVKIENRKILRKYKKQGYFIYGNHTQTMGDAFIPAHVSKYKRIYVVVSQANLGVVGIGRLLPMLGAIPLASSIADTKKVWEAITTRIKQKKCVVIYPEAHVWPYYTKIRLFDSSSFKFPVSCNVPSFVITTTYYKRKFGKKPGIKVFVDGPFLPDNTISKKEKEEKLCKEVYECMKNRSKNSTYEYIEYKRQEN